MINQTEESLVAQRIVHNAILDAGGLTKVEITKSLVQYAKNSHDRYIEASKRKKQEAIDKDNEAARKRKAAQDIKELEAKKAKIFAAAQKEALLLDEQLKRINK